jgi:recombination protein RecR
MKVAKALTDVIESFEKLPGIGPKTAQRLAYYLLHVPQSQLDDFSASLEKLKKDTVLCDICKNVAETNPCSVCDDERRDYTSVLVVEQPLDVLVFERTGKYQGLYHVLHGSISPLDNIGPDELYIEDLIKRIREGNGHSINEVIIATNPTMEGEATSMYLKKRIEELGKDVKVSRLGMGIPTGAYVEFADDTTLIQAFEGRREI